MVMWPVLTLGHNRIHLLYDNLEIKIIEMKLHNIRLHAILVANCL